MKQTIGVLLMLALCAASCHTARPNSSPASKDPMPSLHAVERQLTFAAYGHILTNCNVWSPDGKWIAYDVRSDPAGSKFDGDRIEAVNVDTGEVQLLYRSIDGAHCGVVTWHPTEPKVVFILGPEKPTADYQYGPSRRRGVIVDQHRPGVATPLDARHLTPPFTPGALRGGSHVHIFSPDGQLVSFTYDDDVLSRFTEPSPDHDVNQRNVAVGVPRTVQVKRDNPRNQDGAFYCVLATRTTSFPQPGSDDITRAYEDAWIGIDGYTRADGSRQKRALAFQGDVLTPDGRTIAEAFTCDLPDDLTQPGDGPLQGTETRRPSPPRGTVQRRLTFTADRKYPGLQGPRHWLRSSPDGSQIALLMKDDAGVVQLWTVSPNGGPPRRVTRGSLSIASSFTWSPDGSRIAHVADNSVCVTDVASGATTRLTTRATDANSPRPEACVFSPDGRSIAYIAPVSSGDVAYNQVFITAVPPR